ncbi:hypothetical protein [Thalassobacillus sp. C254]|uniref:hypothetical protein n=1 Tax=Thalassobacillus sp. C254 TaxID=1225341 RepID=UPI0006CFDEA8|nr:hypothetical protein [Thalassobacillus sp. C254]
MIADNVLVETKRLLGAYETSEPIELTLEGIDGFFWYKKGSKKVPGTKITLELKDDSIKHLKTEEDLTFHLLENVTNPDFVNPLLKVNGVPLNSSTRGYSEIDRYQKWGGTSDNKIEYYYIEINAEGIEGNIEIALLKEEDQYVKEVILWEKDVDVNGTGCTLEEKLQLGVNSIEHTSDSISHDGDVPDVNSGSYNELITDGKLFLNGIRINENIFNSPVKWGKRSEPEKIELPFALKYNLNLTGKTDLNLTASRENIVKDDLWFDFKKQLTNLILKGLVEKINSYDKCLNLLEVFGQSYGLDREILETFESNINSRFS